MIIIPFILFFINILLNFIFKLFLFKSIYVKILALLIMLYFFYKLFTYPRRSRLRLSSLRKIRQFFPYKYKITSVWDEVKSLCICICYLLIFIFGLLLLRFRNVNREINLKLFVQKLYDIFLKTDGISITLNLCLIFISIALYYYGFPYILRFFKFHCRRIHYYYYNGLLRNTSLKCHFYNMFCNKLSYSTTHFYSKLTEASNYILYYLKLKKASYTRFTSSYRNIQKSFDLIVWEKPTLLERLFYGYLNAYEHKLHYHILCGVFFYDILYNNCILKHIYIIMPYIFLYELWVRYSKMITFKNRMYDVIVHYFIHKPLLQIDDSFMTFGDRVIEKEFLINKIIPYVHNDFLDKEIIARWNKINTEYNPVQLLETLLGYPFYYILFICISIYFFDLLISIL